MTNISHFDDEKMFFSSPLSTSDIIYSEMPQAAATVENAKRRATRRRRKKEKSEDIGSGGEWKKRRLTDEQVKFLEMNFGEERKLESGRKVSLANEVGLDPKQVAVWFQNRRARWKNKQLEDEYMKIKSQHDATVVDKCHLENENLKLKQLLSEAEEEIKRLSLQNGGLTGSGGGGNGGGGSPSSSSTNTFQPCLGEFGMEEDHLMYANEYTFANYIMDWGYLL